MSSSALELKASGNDKFRAQDYAAAEADYSAAIDLCSSSSGYDNSSLKVALLSNRAACRAASGNAEGAVTDAKGAIALDPTYTKCYFRLAQLLCKEDSEEAGRMVCIAVALSRGKIDPALGRLFQEVRTALLSSSATAKTTSLWLPASMDCVRLVSPGICSITKSFRFSRNSVVVCALPGKYTEAMQMDALHKRYVLIGVGEVTIDQMLPAMNTLYAASALSVYVSSVTFTGGRAGTSQAAIGLCHGNLAVFLDCRVFKYAGGGLLVATEGTKAILSRCVFQLLPFMAIEVREGGFLVADCIEISSCKQGVIAYGGAKHIDISKSSIVDCTHEGILLAGSFQNAATAMQIELTEKVCGKRESTQAREISEAATNWARARGIQLIASVSETTIQGCGQFGVSIDSGAQVCVYACTLVNNDPQCVTIRGGSDLSIAACRLEFSSTDSKSPHTFLQRKAIPSNLPSHLKNVARNIFKQSGLTIGANYNGNVSISSCVTVGVDDSMGIVEESSLMKTYGLSKMDGMPGVYSKPAKLFGYSHYQPNDSAIPSIADLVNHLPLSWRSAHASRDLGARPQPALGALRRPCRPHQDASWSPTGSENYAIGNTAGYNVTAGVGIPLGTTRLSVLFGASGDIRNLLSTVASSPLEICFDFVVNDGNIAMLARNAVMLEMIACEAPAEHILSVWANHELTVKQNESMMSAILKLAASPWPEWLTATNGLGAENTDYGVENELRAIFNVWLTCGLPSSSILAERSSMMNANSGLLRNQSISLTKDAVGTKVFSKYQKEISAYIDRGSLVSKGTKRLALTKLNVTLLLPELQYTVYFSSSIFRAVALDDSSRDSAHAALLHTLEPKFKRLSTALQLKRCNVFLLPGDILTSLTDNNGDACYDFIDCSNVADYLSLPALAQAAAPRLKPAKHSRLFMESLVMFNLNSATAKPFVEAMFGYQLPTIERMIGLQLLVGEDSPTWVGAHGLRMEFARTHSDDAIDWVGVCAQLARPAALDMYARVSSVTSTSAPAAYASPMTLVHLLTSCTQPELADILVRTILRCGQERLRFFEWEIKSQAAYQLDLPESSGFARIKYTGIPASTMTLFSNHPVVLGISNAPLSGLSISLNQVSQLLSTFAWDAEMFSAEFLLANALVSDGADTNLYVTLLLLGVSGLAVAASSEKLSGLSRQLVDKSDPLTRWRSVVNHHEVAAVDQALLDQLNRLNSCATCKLVCICNKCARCHQKSYCSKQCQIHDWKKGHKRECEAAQKTG